MIKSSLIGISVVVGIITWMAFGGWILPGVATVTTYLLALFTVGSQNSFQVINYLIGSNGWLFPDILPTENKFHRELRIVFGVLSSKDSSAAITQLADSVWPHRLIVHHDFTKFANFSIERANVTVLSNTIKTAWGDWTLVDATLLLIKEALLDHSFTYFQLLSESCLPVRPITEFENYLHIECPNAMIDLLPLDSQNKDVLLSHAWRYLPRKQIIRRILRRAIVLCQGHTQKSYQKLSINTILLKTDDSFFRRIIHFIAQLIVSIFLSPLLGQFPVGSVKKCWVGGQWFGMSRPMAEFIVATIHKCPKIIEYFSSTRIPDESFFHTLIANSGFDRIYPSNHTVFWKSNGTGPDQLTQDELDSAQQSGRFFSRKFSIDSMDAIRSYNLSCVLPNLKNL